MKHRSKSKFTFPKFNFIFNKNHERISSSAILIKGNLLTCIILSIASGVIDLAFFSGLSKSLLHIGTIPMASAILYTLISIGFISAKFWCAMRIGMIKELETKLLAKGYAWASSLKKAQIPWHIAHKFLIAISIITALSLSVNSVGSAMKDAERNTTNITISIDELKMLKDQKKSDNQDKRSLTRGNLEGTATASIKAQENADKYWYIFEDWQTKLHEYELQLNSFEDEEDKKVLKQKIEKERKDAFNKAPRGIGLTLSSMDDMSPIVLKNLFTKAAKQSEVDNDGLAAYESLANENNEEIRNMILALENLYKHPNEYKDGLMAEGRVVSFLDENGEPLDITQVIGILQGLREEWKSNSDIGESAQIFMLVSELITSKIGEGNSSGSGIAETLMMIFIAIAGIVQEFLIYLFTPKAAIDRKLLRQVSDYLYWPSVEEKERFLISLYIEYKGDGVINQEQFNFACQKCVKDMEETEDSIVNRYSEKIQNNDQVNMDFTALKNVINKAKEILK